MNQVEHPFVTTITTFQRPFSTSITDNLFETVPPEWKVTKLDSTLEIKQAWLYSEWDGAYHWAIRLHFPRREELQLSYSNPNVNLINDVFNSVRGNYSLWQAPREEGGWKRVEAPALTLDWVKKNVKVLYPSEDRFSVSNLDCIVLWREKNHDQYQLYDGNHRISNWLANNNPLSLPAVLYIGNPKES